LLSGAKVIASTFSAPRDVDRGRQRVTGELAGLRRDLPAGQRIGIRVGEVDDRHARVGPIDLGRGADSTPGKAHASIAHSKGEHTHIADHHEPRRFFEPTLVEGLCHDFGTDPGAISHEDGNAGRSLGARAHRLSPDRKGADGFGATP
jgi:hypothetical protein